MAKMETLSPQQTRKLVLHSQGLPPAKQTGTAIATTLAVIERLGYIQIDTISVVQRAHHHTLWTRNPRYQNAHLDQLIADKQIFEHWSHAAAYLPMSDYRYSLIRKQAIANSEQNHWYTKDEKMMKEVLNRIRIEGPLMAKDFKHTGEKSADWASKPAKRALEQLFIQGELMIPSRHNFHKLYDLTERVLPKEVDTSLPTPDEYARFLIRRYLQSNGLGQAAEMCYLLKNTKSLIASNLQDMLTSGNLIQIKTAGNIYYALPNALEVLNKPLSRNKLKILSPFDNLLIQRKRMQALFNFDYQIECYVPEPKRQYGYFTLPILWDGKLVARMDCKADRKTSVLHIKHLSLEDGLLKTEAFALALSKELAAFMMFNGCSHLELHRTTPVSFKEAFQKTLKDNLS